MTRQQLALVLATGIIVGALAGWLRPVPVVEKPSDNDTSSWSLPPGTALERSTSAQFAAMQGMRWVGDNSDPGGDGSAPVWTLRGLLPAEGAILVQIGTEPIKRIQSGDILPDRSRLISVDRNSAMIERDGCQTRRNLYPHPADENTPEGSECAATGP